MKKMAMPVDLLLTKENNSNQFRDCFVVDSEVLF